MTKGRTERTILLKSSKKILMGLNRNNHHIISTPEMIINPKQKYLPCLIRQQNKDLTNHYTSWRRRTGSHHRCTHHVRFVSKTRIQKTDYTNTSWRRQQGSHHGSADALLNSPKSPSSEKITATTHQENHQNLWVNHHEKYQATFRCDESHLDSREREGRERVCEERGLMGTPCHEAGNATNPPAPPLLQPIGSNLQLKSA